MKALHVAFEGFTATFKMPFINTGVAVSAPVPSYSTIAGLISCCAGRYIDKEETLIGFKYLYDGMGRDLETTRRLGIDDKGILKRVSDTGIGIREFHVNPRLDIYLSNTGFKKYFEYPAGVPTLGRSQDIAWITKIEEVELKETEEGNLKPTLIPFPCSGLGGRVIRYCDYFYNNDTGYLRIPDKMILYQVVPYIECGVHIKRRGLFALPESEYKEAIYMHKLGDKT